MMYSIWSWNLYYEALRAEHLLTIAIATALNSVRLHTSNSFKKSRLKEWQRKPDSFFLETKERRNR